MLRRRVLRLEVWTTENPSVNFRHVNESLAEQIATALVRGIPAGQHSLVCVHEVRVTAGTYTTDTTRTRC